MKKEWSWRSKSGKAYIHAGVGQDDLIGTPHPGYDIPLGEGVRVLAAKGIDRICLFVYLIGIARRLVHGGKHPRFRMPRI
ncbi:MAG: hypothetical protein IK130_00095 [Oscillospiraceae bacterium]|nr:hypothetical protein [Oscillospiraceae bacterium]